MGDTELVQTPSGYWAMEQKPVQGQADLEDSAADAARRHSVATIDSELSSDVEGQSDIERLGSPHSQFVDGLTGAAAEECNSPSQVVVPKHMAFAADFAARQQRVRDTSAIVVGASAEPPTQDTADVAPQDTLLTQTNSGYWHLEDAATGEAGTSDDALGKAIAEHLIIQDSTADGARRHSVTSVDSELSSDVEMQADFQRLGSPHSQIIDAMMDDAIERAQILQTVEASAPGSKEPAGACECEVSFFDLCLCCSDCMLLLQASEDPAYLAHTPTSQFSHN